MTEQEQLELKAKAFDLVLSGEITGAELFWKHIQELKKLPDMEILKAMPALACEVALRVLLEEKEVSDATN